MLNDLKNTLQTQLTHHKTQIKPQASLKPLIKQQVGQGKTVLITGASSGIGAGMAVRFAKLGYNLALCARRLERLETLKSEILADCLMCR